MIELGGMVNDYKVVKRFAVTVAVQDLTYERHRGFARYSCASTASVKRSMLQLPSARATTWQPRARLPTLRTVAFEVRPTIIVAPVASSTRSDHKLL